MIGEWDILKYLKSSLTTGMRKKKEKKSKNIMSRNIKEGSPIEEEFIVELLQEMQAQLGIFSKKNITESLCCCCFYLVFSKEIWLILNN